MYFLGLKTAQNQSKGLILAIFFMPHTNQKRWPRTSISLSDPLPKCYPKSRKNSGAHAFPEKKKNLPYPYPVFFGSKKAIFHKFSEFFGAIGSDKHGIVSR